MAIQFIEARSLFLLQAGPSTYAIKLSGHRIPLHLYWDPALSASALGIDTVRTMDRAFSPTLAGASFGASLDALPQEFPTFGSSDFRQPALGVFQPATGTSPLEIRRALSASLDPNAAFSGHKFIQLTGAFGYKLDLAALPANETAWMIVSADASEALVTHVTTLAEPNAPLVPPQAPRTQTRRNRPRAPQRHRAPPRRRHAPALRPPRPAVTAEFQSVQWHLTVA